MPATAARVRVLTNRRPARPRLGPVLRIFDTSCLVEPHNGAEHQPDQASVAVRSFAWIAPDVTVNTRPASFQITPSAAPGSEARG